jgi:hypothetical protein
MATRMGPDGHNITPAALKALAAYSLRSIPKRGGAGLDAGQIIGIVGGLIVAIYGPEARSTRGRSSEESPG